MTTQTKTANAVTRNTHAAYLILEHADHIGLPPAVSAYTNKFGNTTLAVDSLADLTSWSQWMEEPIVDKVITTNGGVHYTIDGTALDHPIRVIFVDLEPAAVRS